MGFAENYSGIWLNVVFMLCLTPPLNFTDAQRHAAVLYVMVVLST